MGWGGGDGRMSVIEYRCEFPFEMIPFVLASVDVMIPSQLCFSRTPSSCVQYSIRLNPFSQFYVPSSMICLHLFSRSPCLSALTSLEAVKKKVAQKVSSAMSDGNWNSFLATSLRETSLSWASKVREGNPVARVWRRARSIFSEHGGSQRVIRAKSR